MDHILREVGFFEFEAIPQDFYQVVLLFQPVSVTPRRLAEPIEQQLGKVMRRHDPRPFRLDPAFPDTHGIDLVHQFADQKKAEAGGSKGLDHALGLHHHARVFHGILEIVLFNHRESIIRRAGPGAIEVSGFDNSRDLLSTFSHEPAVRHGPAHRATRAGESPYP